MLREAAAVDDQRDVILDPRKAGGGVSLAGGARKFNGLPLADGHVVQALVDAGASTSSRGIWAGRSIQQIILHYH